MKKMLKELRARRDELLREAISLENRSRSDEVKATQFRGAVAGYDEVIARLSAPKKKDTPKPAETK